MDRQEQGLKISVELPAEAAEIDCQSATELASELRLLWIIDAGPLTYESQGARAAAEARPVAHVPIK